MASTIKMPPKQQTNEEVVEPRAGQGRSVLHRYLIQVDRQTKSSFDDKATAEKLPRRSRKRTPSCRSQSMTRRATSERGVRGSARKTTAGGSVNAARHLLAGVMSPSLIGRFGAAGIARP